MRVNEKKGGRDVPPSLLEMRTDGWDLTENENFESSF